LNKEHKSTYRKYFVYD